MGGQLYHFAPWQNLNMNGNKCDSENSENCSVAIYSIINCLIVFIVISELRLEYEFVFESEMRKVLLYHFAPCTVSFCPVHDHTF